jgi:hypothetical protein
MILAAETPVPLYPDRHKSHVNWPGTEPEAPRPVTALAMARRQKLLGSFIASLIINSLMLTADALLQNNTSSTVVQGPPVRIKRH